MDNPAGFGKRIEEYEVGHLLGKGGFAKVFKARCMKTQVQVAIKMIDKKLMHSSGMMARVHQEVSIHSKLKHPSILELYTFFEDSCHVYLILEYCENGELQKYLKQHNKILKESEAYEVLHQVIDGLKYLHSHNIVHRDLTLANILLTHNMRIKIADFGLATQLLTPNETHMTMCGTPNYISPEVATRSCHGLQVDVWGLGVMLYTLLVGSPPFDTSAVKSTLTKVVMSDFKLPVNMSHEAKDLINNLLQKNPKNRLSLPDILKHPFMLKHQSSRPFFKLDQSTDSGNFTMSTATISNKSGSVSRTPSIQYENGSFSKFSNSSRFSNCEERLLPKEAQPVCLSSSSGDTNVNSVKCNCENTSKIPCHDVHQIKPNGVHESLHSCQIDPGRNSSCEVASLRKFSNSAGQNQCCSGKNDAPPCTVQHFANCDKSSNCTCRCVQRFSNLNFDDCHSQPCCQKTVSREYSFRSDDRFCCDHTHKNLVQNVKCNEKSNCKVNECCHHSVIKNSNQDQKLIGGITNISLYDQKDHTDCKIVIDGVKVPPLSSVRLHPARHKTNKAVLSILESGEVVLEFIKKRGKEERVGDCCRISKDGLRVLVYTVNRPLREKPPDLPEQGTDGIYSYENLPQKHWKKYLYAAMFVNLVKAKTPKITFYSEQAKCLLMENSPDDFEALYYSGGKINKTGNIVKVIDDSGFVTSFQMNDISEQQTSSVMLQHFVHCFNHCLMLEKILSEASTSSNGLDCFPVIIGQRPNSGGNVLQPKENLCNSKSLTSSIIPVSMQCSKSALSMPITSRAQSTPREKRPTGHLNRETHVPGIGIAIQYPTGEIKINYHDGSKLSFNSKSGAILFSNSTDTTVEYNQREAIPKWLKSKLQDIPKVIPYLLQETPTATRIQTMR
ncbi:UNVERIFIED_CONTAM: hypothetical protein PYX00_010370 [Menopon gallinae]|uniref:Serine/threonine-protein kinase PLK4 n=1 Tax=Menopon gallinae TaxID=328185 RepID=A0AAW2HFE9_9NEOP